MSSFINRRKSGELHKPIEIHDRAQTQLAYEANYYPDWDVTAEHKIVWSKTIRVTKKELVALCTSKEMVRIRPELTATTEFAIHWQYNNVPTATEWAGFKDNQMFLIEFRISPLIESCAGRAAVVSKLKGQFRGED